MGWMTEVSFPAGAGVFSHHYHVQTSCGAQTASYPIGTVGSLPGKSSHSMKLATHLHLTSRSRMHSCTSTPPVCLHGNVHLNRYIFMVWYLVKHRRQLYLYLISDISHVSTVHFLCPILICSSCEPFQIVHLAFFTYTNEGKVLHHCNNTSPQTYHRLYYTAIVVAMNKKYIRYCLWVCTFNVHATCIKYIHNLPILTRWSRHMIYSSKLSRLYQLFS